MRDSLTGAELGQYEPPDLRCDNCLRYAECDCEPCAICGKPIRPSEAILCAICERVVCRDDLEDTEVGVCSKCYKTLMNDEIPAQGRGGNAA